MMRKLPSFAEQIFRIMLNFLLDIEVRIGCPFKAHWSPGRTRNAHTSCQVVRSLTYAKLTKTTKHVSDLLLQDDPLWHRADSNQYENEGEGELYEFGQVCASPACHGTQSCAVCLCNFRNLAPPSSCGSEVLCGNTLC